MPIYQVRVSSLHNRSTSHSDALRVNGIFVHDLCLITKPECLCLIQSSWEDYLSQWRNVRQWYRWAVDGAFTLLSHHKRTTSHSDALCVTGVVDPLRHQLCLHFIQSF